MIFAQGNRTNYDAVTTLSRQSQSTQLISSNLIEYLYNKQKEPGIQITNKDTVINLITFFKVAPTSDLCVIDARLLRIFNQMYAYHKFLFEAYSGSDTLVVAYALQEMDKLRVRLFAACRPILEGRFVAADFEPGNYLVAVMEKQANNHIYYLDETLSINFLSMPLKDDVIYPLQRKPVILTTKSENNFERAIKSFIKRIAIIKLIF